MKKKAIIIPITGILLILLFYCFAVARNNYYQDKIRIIDGTVAQIDSAKEKLGQELDALPTDYNWRLYNKMLPYFVDEYSLDGRIVYITHKNSSGFVEKHPNAKYIKPSSGWSRDDVPSVNTQLTAAQWDALMNAPENNKNEHVYYYVDYYGFERELASNTDGRVALPVEDDNNEISIDKIKKGIGYTNKVYLQKCGIQKSIDSLQSVKVDLMDKHYRYDLNKWGDIQFTNNILLFSSVVAAICSVILGIMYRSIFKRKLSKRLLSNIALLVLLLTIFAHILLVENKTYNGMSREQYGKPEAYTRIMYFGVIPLWVNNIIYCIYFIYAGVIAFRINKIIRSKLDKN